IFPARPLEWNSSASASVYLTLLSDMGRGLSPIRRSREREAVKVGLCWGLNGGAQKCLDKSGIPAFAGMTNKASQTYGPSRRSDTDDGAIPAPEGRGRRCAAVL